MVASIKTFLNNLGQKRVLAQLIIINICIFLIFAFINVISVLFQLDLPNLVSYIGVSSNLGVLITHTWTVLTYMFVHYEIFHILFNMLMLYWFGNIFLMYFTPKNLVALYILGGLAGAILYIILFNTIPYFLKLGDSYMVGASASVMAIVFASAFYNKNLEVRLFLFGQIKIIYIALFIFILDFISLGRGSNVGGHVAHIGGAALGYLFATQYLNGKDITMGLNLIIDKIVNLVKPKPKMRVTFSNRGESDQDYNKRKHDENEMIDQILDKIKKSGYKSLNEKEKKQLFDASNR